jgi:fructose-bisphosphate aldolase/6-deoxy-5-ketofructose 1-phosphate synthase
VNPAIGNVPADVPAAASDTYLSNLKTVTRGTGRLFLFAGDQKVEHLNDDFFGEGIADDDAEPEHLFRIASEGPIGAFATQIGLLARFGLDYPDVPYVAKLNAKTHLQRPADADPRSLAWATVADALTLRERGLPIVGVGFSVYPGSEFESEHFAQASRICIDAHQAGLLAILWAYPRGKAVTDEKDPHVIAGAAGLGAALGADFCKVNYPGGSPADFAEAVRAAGRTKVISAGGGSVGVGEFLGTLHDQIHIAGASGNATGRNIHQKPLAEAVQMTYAVAAVTNGDWSVEDALAVYEGTKSYEPPPR